MKHLIPVTLLALSACAAPQQVDYNQITTDTIEEKLTTPPAPPQTPDLVKCPVKSPMPDKWVKPGHEDVLCYGDPKERPEEPKEPPTECSSYWNPNVRYALGYQKTCA